MVEQNRPEPTPEQKEAIEPIGGQTDRGGHVFILDVEYHTLIVATAHIVQANKASAVKAWPCDLREPEEQRSDPSATPRAL